MSANGDNGDLLRRLRAAADLLRPRSLARTAKSVEDLAARTERLQQAARDSASHAARVELALREIRESLVESQRRDSELASELNELKTLVSGVDLRVSQLAAIHRANNALAEEVDRLPTLLDADATVTHVAQALATTPIHPDPFPHMVVADAWPESFYDALVKGLPPAELFADRPRNKRQLAVPFDLAPMFSSRVWQFLASHVLNRRFAALIAERFREPLGEWLLTNWPLPEENPISSVKFQCNDGRLFLRHRGYVIPPHRDPKWGFITCLLYLARPGDSETWGTQLYSVNEDAEAPNMTPHWIDATRCRLEKDVPFRRNTMLVFMNSRGAHGAHIPEDAMPPDLERYMYQFRIGPTPNSVRELMRLLPEERRGAWAGKVSDYS